MDEQLHKALELVEKYRQQAENERQRADDATQRAEDERQRAEDERQRAEDERQRANDAAQHERETTLTEYLDLCHTHLFRSISVQTDKSLTTLGDITSPKGKLRPNRIRPWIDFLSTQKLTQERLQSAYTDYDKKRIFENFSCIQGLGKRVALRKVASEADLANIQREAIETPVATIINYLQSLDSVQKEFDIGDGISFDNHANGLSDEEMEVSQRLENLQPFTPNHSTLKHSTYSFNGLRADQLCVYTIAKDKNTRKKLAFVIEYKAPHKLNLPSLRFGLRDMDVKSAIDSLPPAKVQGTDNLEHFQYHADRLVASAITQTFSYMIQGGTQYGYITTGEAFIFLRILLDDPGTIYYHLVEPEKDVSAQKEEGQEFLHRTAVSQILAFTLLALESEAGNQKWVEDTKNMLDIWEVDYEAILRDMPDSVRTDPPASEYRPKTYIPARNFNMKLRSKSTNSTCRPDTSPIDKDDPESPDTSDNESPPDTPTRLVNRKPRDKNGKGSKNANANASQYKTQNRSFCTQHCLYGLAEGGNLDLSCPNILDHYKKNHKSNKHQLNRQTFLTLLHQQLERTLDDDCYPLDIQGARGALFKITLTSHGYTVAAKGTVRAFVQDLQHEFEIYERLKKIQGVCIPICFGSIDLAHPYYYDIGVEIIHMMILSWAGERLDKCKVAKEIGQKSMDNMVMQSIKKIHQVGILHKDLRVPNVLWNVEMKRVMLIDFERSEVLLDLRKGTVQSPNQERRGRKRRLLSEKQAVLSKKSDDSSTMLKSQVRLRFAYELSIAQRELID